MVNRLGGCEGYMVKKLDEVCCDECLLGMQMV